MFLLLEKLGAYLMLCSYYWMVPASNNYEVYLMPSLYHEMILVSYVSHLPNKFETLFMLSCFIKWFFCQICIKCSYCQFSMKRFLWQLILKHTFLTSLYHLMVPLPLFQQVFVNYLLKYKKISSVLSIFFFSFFFHFLDKFVSQNISMPD